MSRHQYAMVLDLNKCLGCHTCSMACKKLWTDSDGMDYMYWNNVETRPGQGYPRYWDRNGGGFNKGELQPTPDVPPIEDYGHAFEYNYDDRLFRGKKGPVMPHVDPKNGSNWDEDSGSLDKGENYYFYVPRLCNHCTHPACVAACPRQAIYKRDEDGIVLIDQDRCEGYRLCVRACPYKKIYFNEVFGRSQKCIFCYPRLEKDLANACARQCPGRIRFVGLLDDPDSPVYQIVAKYKAALPLLPDRGTKPNVYYVPPFNPPKRGNYAKDILDDPRIPMDYLVSLFGEEVVPLMKRLSRELKMAQGGKKSELLQLLIGRDAEQRFKVATPDEIAQK